MQINKEARETYASEPEALAAIPTIGPVLASRVLRDMRTRANDKGFDLPDGIIPTAPVVEMVETLQEEGIVVTYDVVVTGAVTL